MRRIGRWLGTSLLLLLAAGASARADSIRGHHVHSGHSHGSWGGAHVTFVSPYFGFTPFYYGYNYGYGYGYPAPYPYYGGYQPYYVSNLGYLDTDISPEEAEVVVDGEYAGTADDFDGFPDYLALEPGRHTLIFRAPGRRTVTRVVRVARGAVIDLDFTLPKGEGEESPPAGSSRLEVGALTDEPDSEREEPEAAAEPGFARLSITPADASVYLDHEYLGTAALVSRLHGDLRLEPGGHLLQVVRPGYVSGERDFVVAPGERRRVQIDLEKETGR